MFSFFKDTLVKQGLTTQKAESLLRLVSKNACTVKFIKIAKQLITKLVRIRILFALNCDNYMFTYVSSHGLVHVC